MDTRRVPLGALAAHIGVVTQDPENQLFNLFVSDEVTWGMENRGMDRSSIAQRLDSSLEFFKIAHLRERITYDLSGGEKQRLVLAATYAPSPRMFLLDEPTSQLDPVGAEEVLEGIRALAGAGHTILVVEEKLEELWSVVDRVVLLNGGTVQLDVPRDQLDRVLGNFVDADVSLPPLVELGAKLRGAGVIVPPLPPDPDRAADLVRAAGLQPARAARRARPQGPPRVRVTGLVYTYPPPRTTAVLRGVDLELPSASLIAVVGQNGSGKTTLARCLSGELRPTAGTVLINGKDVHRMAIRERVRHVGYVFQNPDHQIFKDPVLEDVCFGPMNLGSSRQQALEVSERVLRALDLWDKRDVHPFRLSKGDRQRLAIAAITAMRPDVVIVDEPTTGQDLREAHAIMAHLLEMTRQEGQTVIVITHAMQLVATYADLVVALHGGRVIAFGPPEDIFRQETVLRRTMVKPPAVVALGNRLGLNPPPLTLEEAFRAFLDGTHEVVTPT
jgi:energy-coupling factor transport system ATP-binding protein